jgi:hypothetical protein
MKKFLFLLLLLTTYIGSAQIVTGPQTITNVNTAAGTPDFYVRPSNNQVSKMSWANVFSAFSSALNTTYYPFSSNPANYLTSGVAAGLYYPLSTNPAGYLSQQTVLEYADLASLPITGTSGIIYVANNNATTGVPVYYIWNGSAYVTTAQPVTGITGSGTVNRIPKFGTPTSLINSNFTDDGVSGRYSSGSQYVEFVNSPSAVLRLARSQSRIDFFLGNAGFGVYSGIYSSQALEGLDVISEGDLMLSAGAGGGSGNPQRRVYINRTSGNVGIGTGLTASDRLHVSGDLRVTGGYKDSSNSIGTSGQVLTSTATGTAWVAPGSIGSSLYVSKTGDTMTGDLIVLTTPPTANSAASRNFVETLFLGLSWKTQVKCSTTANHSLSGTASVDGVTVPAGTRVLVRFQTAPEQNGIWISAAGSWTRAPDADIEAELETCTVSVTSGTLYGKTIWNQYLTITTLNVSAVGFTNIPTAGAYTADGTYLNLISNVFSINTTNTATVTTPQTFQNKTISGSNNTFANIAQSAITNLIADLAVINGNIAANTAAIATKEIKLTITSVKTTSYSVQANEFVPVDTTSGNITLTLPTAPADGTQAGGKLSVLGGTNSLIFNTGGSDVINVTGGVTTVSLTILNQVVIFQYKASSAVWYAVDSSISTTWINSQLSLKKSIATGNNYKWETTSSSGNLQETTVTANKAVATDSNGLPVASGTSDVQLGYLSTTTSDVQTQINTNFQRSILRQNHFWIVPASINAAPLSFTYSPQLSQSSFTFSGNVAGSRGMISFATTSTAGTIAFIRRHDGLNFTGLIGAITRKISFQTNVSGQRFFCGWSKGFQFTTPTNVDQTTLVDLVGVAQLSTSTNMHILYNDGSGTASTIDLGSNYPCNDSQYTYYITIETTSTTFIVTVERVTNSTGATISTSNTLSTNIPNYATVGLGPMQMLTWISNNATAAVSSYLDGGGEGYYNN